MADAAAGAAASAASTAGAGAGTGPPGVKPKTATTTPAHNDLAVPVALNEAAADSPTFRASVVSFGEQVDGIERWLEAYMRSTSKLVLDILALEETVNNFVARMSTGAGAGAGAHAHGPSGTNIIPGAAAEALLDSDYTALALRRVADGTREWWGQILGAVRRMDILAVEPIRAFLGGDLRAFKEARTALERTQRTFDQTLARYASQPKGKEPSAIREDAFAVFEARRAYLKASMDFCLLAPQLRFTLDRLLVRVCTDMWRESKRAHDAAANAPARTTWAAEMERVRGWSREMEASEAVFKRQLQAARRDIGEAALNAMRPSRELDDYNAYTVPFLSARGRPVQPKDETVASGPWEKQGWLFLRTQSGKPVRTQWIRRWYYCKDGIFGWLVQGPQGVLQGDEIGVLLCNARPAIQEDRRFCFEVKTKNQTTLLQAETQAQLSEWLDVFEVAKKHAFEATLSRDSSSLPGGVDPAFSVTTASIPEFSAKSLEAHLTSEDSMPSGFERSGTLPIPGAGDGGGLAPRASFDVGGAQGPRRSLTALAREEGETSRDHAARLMQNLHRKATFGDGGPSSSPGAAGGIASLISASHGLLPGYPAGILPGAPVAGAAAPRPPPLVTSLPADLPAGSLAPSTLAKPPAPTGLSRTAMVVTAERGLGMDRHRGMPMAIMANYWGSSVHTAARGSPAAAADPSSLPSTTGFETFPPNYPVELKAQTVQFRLLFPKVPLDEKLVLVFRAAWSSSSEAGPSNPGLMGYGRVYVTPDNMYFYGHQMGLVVAYGIPLDEISEVTAAPGKECDFIFLHLTEDANDSSFTRVTLKVFLEDLDLLHARLNLLVDDLQAEEPMDISSLLTALAGLEREAHVRKSPSVESWEEVSPTTPIDDRTALGRPAHLRGHRPQYHGSDRLLRRHMPKFRLPSQPVVYEPADMAKKAEERHFEISAKACFHVLFGDKSFVFPKLYFDRGAEQISQAPWTLGDHGKMRREFTFKVDHVDMLGRSRAAEVTDWQSIDVFSDHVTYVVTHVKTAWHLPHSQYFKLVSKIVITHVAKSKCRLAIYTRVDWSKSPAFSKKLVERQAMDDADHDAEQLAEVATDQVRRLGAHSRTKRAIQVYGHIGQQTQAVAFTPADDAASSDVAAGKKQGTSGVRPRTLTAMIFDTLRSFAESAASSLLMWAFAGLKKLFSVVTANRVILAVLAASLLANAAFSSRESSAWWAERRALRYMRRLGVGPNPVMSKVVYIADLDAAGIAEPPGSDGPPDSQWYVALPQTCTSMRMKKKGKEKKRKKQMFWVAGPNSFPSSPPPPRGSLALLESKQPANKVLMLTRTCSQLRNVPVHHKYDRYGRTLPRWRRWLEPTFCVLDG